MKFSFFFGYEIMSSQVIMYYAYFICNFGLSECPRDFCN